MATEGLRFPPRACPVVYSSTRLKYKKETFEFSPGSHIFKPSCNYKVKKVQKHPGNAELLNGATERSYHSSARRLYALSPRTGRVRAGSRIPC